MIKITLVLVLLLSSYKVSAECDYTINEGISIMSESCPLFIASSMKAGSVYYLQVSYVSPKYAVQKMLSIANETNHPVAMHSYGEGYRLLVGPTIKININSLKKILARVGYEKVILKSLNIGFIKSTAVKKSLNSMKVQPVWRKLGSINSRVAMLPIDDVEKLLLYKVDVYRGACKYLGASATIATYEEYLTLFSSLSGADKLWLKYRFWLTNGKTITRVSNDIVIQNNTGSNETRPLVCVIDFAENNL